MCNNNYLNAETMNFKLWEKIKIFVYIFVLNAFEAKMIDKYWIREKRLITILFVVHLFTLYTHC